jgi:hypothetical protein
MRTNIQKTTARRRETTFFWSKIMECKYCKTEVYRWDEMVRGNTCHCGKLVFGVDGFFYLGEEKIKIKCGHCQSREIKKDLLKNHYICQKCGYYIPVKEFKNFISLAHPHAEPKWYTGDLCSREVRHDKTLEATNEFGTVRETKKGKGAYELISPIGLKELALVYEEGAEHHESRNWEKGMKFGGALQSAIRHIQQYLEGMRDERHLGQAVWNIFAVIHFEELIKRGLAPKELNDLPCYIPKETNSLDVVADNPPPNMQGLPAGEKI